MTAAFGTGFSVVFVFSALAGLAVLLGLSAAGILRRHEPGERLPLWTRVVPIVLVVEVVAATVVGLLAFSGSAPVAVAMLATLVVLPLVAVAVRTRRRTRLDWRDVVATTALAWSLPFLVGLALFLGLTRAIAVFFGTDGSARGLVELGLVSTMVSGVVVVAGVGLLASRLAPRFVASRRRAAADDGDSDEDSDADPGAR